jgi:2-polyprenyl-6-methoxyphenol hydroxylase-like FAD-dependent oxidoreductase
MKVLVAGGSLGGLFVAALLHRAGMEVAVHERSAQSLAGRGAGLVMQPEMAAILDELDHVGAAATGVAAPERIFLDTAGRVTARHAMPQTQISWDRVFLAVHSCLPAERYLTDRTVLKAGQDGNIAWLGFADGTVEYADLVIGADGIGSVVRAALPGGEAQPVYAGYAAWRGLVAEAALPRDAANLLYDRFAFFDEDGSHVLGYLVPGPDGSIARGRRRYNWVWYRRCPEADGSLAAALTDVDGYQHAYSLPPGAMSGAARDTLRLEAHQRLPPPFAAAVEAEPQPFVQGIFDYTSDVMAEGRIALVGDAAFVVRPHTAMGVAKAAGDARALRDALTALTPGGGAGMAEPHLAKALAAYHTTRHGIGAAIAARGRRLGAAFT